MTSTEKIAGLKDWITWISQTSAWRDEASSDVVDRAEVGASQWRQTEHYKGDGPLSNHLRLSWARQEIARLEALEHTEAVCGHTRPVPGYGKCLLPKRHMGMHQNEPIAMKPGESVNGVRLEHAEANAFSFRPMPELESRMKWYSMEQAIFPREYVCQWVDDTGNAKDIQPTVKVIVTAGSSEGVTIEWATKPTEQRLDDFMRDREDADDRRRALEQAPVCRISDRAEQGLAGEEDSEQSNRPASRELVERMVREATSHSVWPVTVVVPDPREPTGYHAMFHRPDGGSAIALEYGALSRHAADEAESMATLIEACSIMRMCVTHHNAKACPSCNGSAKVRGYFFGEKQCPDCEGTGVR